MHCDGGGDIHDLPFSMDKFILRNKPTLRQNGPIQAFMAAIPQNPIQMVPGGYCRFNVFQHASGGIDEDFLRMRPENDLAEWHQSRYHMVETLLQMAFH